MTDLYLIAHKVRGEPAFDIAERMECPLCSGQGYDLDICATEVVCHECDGAGFWWIIPTSGHRAYPWWSMELYEFVTTMDGIPGEFYEMPPSLPDHYPLRHSPSSPHVDILALLSQEPKSTIRRRL